MSEFNFNVPPQPNSKESLQTKIINACDSLRTQLQEFLPNNVIELQVATFAQKLIQNNGEINGLRI